MLSDKTLDVNVYNAFKVASEVFMVEQCVGDKLRSRLSCERVERASLFDGKPTVIEIYTSHH